LGLSSSGTSMIGRSSLKRSAIHSGATEMVASRPVSDNYNTDEETTTFQLAHALLDCRISLSKWPTHSANATTRFSTPIARSRQSSILSSCLQLGRVSIFGSAPATGGIIKITRRTSASGGAVHNELDPCCSAHDVAVSPFRANLQKL
jgi:hypothetical protein